MTIAWTDLITLDNCALAGKRSISVQTAGAGIHHLIIRNRYRQAWQGDDAAEVRIHVLIM